MKKVIALAMAGLFVSGFAHAEKLPNYKDYVGYEGIGLAKGESLSKTIKEVRNDKQYRYYYDKDTLKGIKKSETIDCRDMQGGDIAVDSKDVVDALYANKSDFVLILKDKKWCWSYGPM